MLVGALLDANRRSPRTLAVADSARALSYGRLTRLAAVLRDVISRETPCARVGIMLPASSAFPAALFGVLWSSKVAVPLNFLLSPEELGPVVEDVREPGPCRVRWRGRHHRGDDVVPEAHFAPWTALS